MSELRTFYCPGRVNILGEHLDYNQGFVLPAAINRGIKATVRVRDDLNIHLKSSSFNEVLEFSLADIPEKSYQWTDYPLGVFHQLKNRKLSGLEISFESNLPDGAGVSSSAAIEVLTAFILNEINQLDMTLWDLVKISQKAENEFVGVNCGIMDQFAVAHGKKNNLLLLNCRDLSFSTVNHNLKDIQLVIVNTSVKRKLEKSEFNLRREQCEMAESILNQKLIDSDLKDLSKIQDSTIKKRARHVIEENIRTQKGAKALQDGDLYTFFDCINSSHDSLKNNYDVTGEALDTIVYESRNLEFVRGSRMTGAGFGGCAIAYVERSHLELYQKIISEKYYKKLNLVPQFYPVEIERGVHERL